MQSGNLFSGLVRVANSIFSKLATSSGLIECLLTYFKPVANKRCSYKAIINNFLLLYTYISSVSYKYAELTGGNHSFLVLLEIPLYTWKSRDELLYVHINGLTENDHTSLNNYRMVNHVNKHIASSVAIRIGYSYDRRRRRGIITICGYKAIASYSYIRNK